MEKKYVKNLMSVVIVVAMVITCLSGTFDVSQAKSQPVRLNATPKTLQVGKTYQLKVKKAKGITINKKTFSKKGTAVKVSKKGKITAKKVGKATVICKVKYYKKGSRKVLTKKLSCKITVKKATNTKSGNSSGGEQTGSKPTNSDQTVNIENTEKPTPAQTADTDMTSSPVPGETAKPEVTNSPAPGETVGPETTNSPAPGETVDPETTNSPAPGETVDPEVTNSPAPGETVGPETTNSPAPGETAKPTATPNPAFDFVHKMGLGINLGNTMEAYCAHATSTDQLERNWGQPITTQEMISGMKNAGFRSLRIPVSWSSMMSDEENYTINEALLARVETIMNYAFQEDMYVIINIHWDGQWWGQFGDKDMSVREKAWARYEAFWTQIADYYKDYSDHLIFESANEELGDRLNDDWNRNGDAQTGTLSTDDCYQTMNAINQRFVDIVRESGGNNATRFLLIAGYNTDIDKTCDDRFQMPTDTIEDHMMVSVHYYTPSTYCIVSDPYYQWGYDNDWGTESDVAAMKAQLANMKINFTDKGIPVVIGEYGVTDRFDGSYVRKDGRDIFFKTLCTYAISNGMCPMLWNTDNVYDKSTCAMKNSTEAADYLALAEEAEAMDVYVPSEFSGEYVWSGTLKNSSYNQFVTTISEESNISVRGNGGCFILSGVEWNMFTNPVIELSSEGLTGSCDCKFATFYVDDPDCPYVDVFYENLWTFGNTVTIDASGAYLYGNQSLYFSLNGEDDFEGSFTIKIKEKAS